MSLWGSQTGLGLCGLCVFIDQAVEDRSALDLHGGLAWCWSGRVGRLLGQGAVGTMIVIVPRVFGQDGGQMSLAEDEYPVGALASDGAHPALGLGVRPGRLRRSAKDIQPGGGEDRVERRGELRVPVMQ